MVNLNVAKGDDQVFLVHFTLIYIPLCTGLFDHNLPAEASYPQLMSGPMILSSGLLQLDLRHLQSRTILSVECQGFSCSDLVTCWSLMLCSK